VELRDGFTNAFALTVDLGLARCQATSSPAGFHLRDLVHDDAVAAVGGSFCYISDDPTYQPAEPCLDLVCRDGQITSLPTVTKPALLIHQTRPLVRTLAPTGTLTIAGHSHTWTGSKHPHQPECLLVDDYVVVGLACLGWPQRGGGGSLVSSRVSRRVMMVAVAHHAMASWCSGRRS
jgi:hypothetical protein